jgi:hypothetical protein
MWRLKVQGFGEAAQCPENPEEYINPETFHARTCRCDACVEYWERQQVEPDRVDTIKKNNHGVDVHEMVGGPRPEDVADALAYGIAGMDFARSAWQKKGDIETDYRPDSLVSRKKARIKELVDAHWSYMEKTLTAGQDKGQMFSWDQVMEMRKWDYTSAATHFYGHGYEDGQNESE